MAYHPDILPLLNPDEIERKECSHIPDPVKRSFAAQKICEEKRARYLTEGRTFAFETVGSHPSRYKFMRQAHHRGYDVELFFISTENPEINVLRVAHRVMEGGHEVPRDKIISRWHRTMNMLPEYLQSCDSAQVVDNSLQRQRNLITVAYRRATIHPAFFEVRWPIPVLDSVLASLHMPPEELIAAKNKMAERRR
jgi:predicted ABC-type ATPase